MPGTDLMTVSNGFVDKFKRAEKSSKLLILGGLGVLGYFLIGPLNNLVSQLVLLAENTLYLGLELGALGVLIFLATNKQVHTIVGAYWRALIRLLMQGLVNMNPISIAENYVRTLGKRIERFDDQIAKLWAQIKMLRKQIHENKIVIAEAERQCQYIKDHSENPASEPAFITNALQAKGTHESNERLSKLLTQLETVHKILGKMREWATTVQKITSDKVDRAKTEDAASRAATGAFRTALSIIQDNSDGKDLYDQAMARLGQNFAESFGAIEEFSRVSEGFLQSIDMNKGIVAEDMLAQLEHMQTRMLGSVSAEVIDATAYSVPASKIPVARSVSLLDDDR